jgi:hypothetical protein
MPASAERIAANRRNALLSTGPKTPEGKEQSRQNAVKHGLTGDCVVIVDEDAAALTTRIAGFEAELKPKGEVGLFLAQRAALLAIRLERAARLEAAALDARILEAETAEADRARQERQAAVDRINVDPCGAIRLLLRSPEGITWMIDTWGDLRVDLEIDTEDRWCFAHREMAENLTGRRIEDIGVSRITKLSRAINGDLHLLSPTDWPDLAENDRQAAAKRELLEFIDDQIAQLRQTLEAFDYDRLRKIRAGARRRALVDHSPEGKLAKRYENAMAREFYKAMAEVERLNQLAEPKAEPAAPPEVDVKPSPAGTSAPLASFGQSAAKAEEAPSTAPSRPRLPSRSERRRDRKRKAELEKALARP